MSADICDKCEAEAAMPNAINELAVAISALTAALRSIRLTEQK